jgi:hypothetical protein
MRYILLYCLLFGINLSLAAQEIKIPIENESAAKEIYLATEGDSISAFVLENMGVLSFWVKQNGSFQKVGQEPRQSGTKYVGSFCTTGKASFVFENAKGMQQYEISTQGNKAAVTTIKLPIGQGKPIQNFVHEGAVFNLTFIKKDNVLRVRQYATDGKAIDKDYVLPNTKYQQYANTSYINLKNLSYRSSHLTDPSVLTNKQHIYVGKDAMYLVYSTKIGPPNYGSASTEPAADVFIVLKLNTQNQVVDRRIIHAKNAAYNDDANLYFFNNSFLLYAINKIQLTLSSIDPISWNVQDFYVLTENDEKLHKIPSRQDGSRTWTLFGNMDRKNLISKLYEYGTAYVYVNPMRDTTGTQEIVVGKVIQNTNTAGGVTIPGSPVPSMVYSNTSIVHHYVMLPYNTQTGTMQTPQPAWKSPTSVWKNMADTTLKPAVDLFGLNPYNPTVTLHHLGDRALIAYIDKKSDAMIVRYEPLK